MKKFAIIMLAVLFFLIAAPGWIWLSITLIEAAHAVN